MTKTTPGNFFEDFRLGQTIRTRRRAPSRPATSRSTTRCYGARFPLQSSDAFAYAIGYPRSPVDDLLVFHIVFGKTVPDISLNAVANLGYADCRFLRAVYPGDTLTAVSRGDRPEGEFEPQDRRRLCALDRLQAGRREGARICALGDGAQARRGGGRAGRSRAASCRRRSIPRRSATPARRSSLRSYDFALAGSPHRFGDYQVGEKIDHVDGMTVEEAEHQIATRLYQNTARVHFNQFTESKGRFGRRLIYGGHVISLARALSFNGLANAFHIAAINGGRHVAPLFAGCTVFAWSEVLAKAELAGTQRCRRAAPAHRRDEGQAVRGFPAQGRRRPTIRR